MIKIKEYKPHYKFTFGKYKGRTFEEITKEDPSYILWCDKNIKWFVIENEEYKSILKELKNKKSRRSSYSTGPPPGEGRAASEQGHLDCFGHMGPNGGWGNIF